MRRVWAPANPPEAKNWPGYALVKVRLIRRLGREQADARGRRPAEAHPEPGNARALRLPLLERRMEDPVAGIHGTPDLVERSASRLRVVDLKSGLRQREVTDDQRRQLLLYGHLVTTTLGEIPKDLIIMDLTGRETIIPFSPSDIADVVQLALQTRESWNSAISEGDTAFSLASASPETCRWCPFRVTCLPYWEACKADWKMPTAVSGNVREVAEADHHFGIWLSQDLPQSASGTRVRLVGITETSVAIGDHIVVTDVDQIGQDAYRLRWWSRVRRTKAT
jgi:RecB family exonuclease